MCVCRFSFFEPLISSIVNSRFLFYRPVLLSSRRAAGYCKVFGEWSSCDSSQKDKTSSCNYIV
ncbi:Protein of unknown function [Pyronema omphalodes CBS 100304]|uniref:Uncharacterized protein n=1 Tax=Pyronema omphalodes (strain CBS 100304) TaxID=1076935 RepID=U4LQL6_PYROM|nr:Protein of unknown function [Pyronema omphalodes CBS 100304]